MLIRAKGRENVSRAEKLINSLLWCLAVGLGGYLAARGFLWLRENPSQKAKEVLQQAYGTVAEDALSCYLPVCFYEADGYEGWLEAAWDEIWEGVPLVTYLQQTEEEETLIEDESTCHEIIEVNGKTITDRLLAENQVKAVDEENQAAAGNEDQEAAEEREKTDQGKESAQANGDTKGNESAQANGDTQGKESAQANEDSQGKGNAQENGDTQGNESAQANGENGNAQDNGTDSKSAEADSGTQEQLPAWTTAVETSPIKDLSMERLSDFNYLLNNFFVVDPNTTIDSSQMDAASLLGDDLKLTGDGSGPQILIYHTHSQEGYADSVEGDENTSVVGVGNYLTSILQDVFGYQVIHLTEAFDMENGQLERSKAYNYALPVVQQVLDENPSIEVVIDLHRDGVPDDKHLVTEINGKQTAQIMYFNGLSRTVKNGNLESLPNPYISDNLAFAFQLSYEAAKYYPRFTRCIYLKGYRYNLHVRPRSILLEVGAQTNTVEEAMNAMEPFSVILNKVLRPE